jgi:nucleotide-binding universal stress UspA family protein
LFPTDFSAASYAALDVAAALARERQATLIVAHCEETPLAVAGGEFAYGIPMATDDKLLSMLDDVLARVDGVHCEKRLLRGVPWRAMVGLAEKENVDLIVLGTHGRTGVARVLMGSIAEAIVRHAKCPVLAIRQGTQAAVQARESNEASPALESIPPQGS